MERLRLRKPKHYKEIGHPHKGGMDRPSISHEASMDKPSDPERGAARRGFLDAMADVLNGPGSRVFQYSETLGGGYLRVVALDSGPTRLSLTSSASGKIEYPIVCRWITMSETQPEGGSILWTEKVKAEGRDTDNPYGYDEEWRERVATYPQGQRKWEETGGVVGHGIERRGVNSEIIAEITAKLSNGTVSVALTTAAAESITGGAKSHVVEVDPLRIPAAVLRLPHEKDEL